jgi:exopolysaccharide biosynthesis polyprenyl glycosylphosphotransferase
MSDIWKEAIAGMSARTGAGADSRGTFGRAWYELFKRCLDRVGTGLGLLLLSPFFALLAILIKLESPGPVLFSQTRIGLGGSPFKCWKLRSMYIDAEQRKQELLEQNEMDGGTTFKMKRDPRVTTVGRFIRKASIDELPQLWNVFVGDMSLVGPRPPVPSEVAQYTARERQRLFVKPGITCIWQVSGRSDIPFPEQVLLDIEYIQKRSLWMDIKLLLRTLPAVLLARGAY